MQTLGKCQYFGEPCCLLLQGWNGNAAKWVGWWIRGSNLSQSSTAAITTHKSQFFPCFLLALFLLPSEAPNRQCHHQLQKALVFGPIQINLLQDHYFSLTSCFPYQLRRTVRGANVWRHVSVPNMKTTCHSTNFNSYVTITHKTDKFCIGIVV